MQLKQFKGTQSWAPGVSWAVAEVWNLCRNPELPEIPSCENCFKPYFFRGNVGGKTPHLPRFPSESLAR